MIRLLSEQSRAAHDGGIKPGTRLNTRQHAGGHKKQEHEEPRRRRRRQARKKQQRNRINNKFAWAAANKGRVVGEWKKRYDGKTEPKK